MPGYLLTIIPGNRHFLFILRGVVRGWLNCLVSSCRNSIFLEFRQHALCHDHDVCPLGDTGQDMSAYCLSGSEGGDITGL